MKLSLGSNPFACGAFNPNFNLDYVHIWHIPACLHIIFGPHNAADHSSQKKDDPTHFGGHPRISQRLRGLVCPRPEDNVTLSRAFIVAMHYELSIYKLQICGTLPECCNCAHEVM